MNIRYPLILSAAVLLTACSEPSRVERVCTVNVKTQKTTNGNELRPDIEAKTIVLVIDEKLKSVTFDSQHFFDKEATITKDEVIGKIERDSTDGSTRYKRKYSLRYQVKTGVIDFVDYFSLSDWSLKQFDVTTVSYNGTCN